MEVNNHIFGMLDLMIRPGFCVKENTIEKVNSAAAALLLTPGTDVRTLLLTGAEEYEAFESGCLYLKLSLSSSGCGASVTKVEGWDVFVLDQEADDGELRAMALAGRELRDPLTSVMIAANQLPAGNEEQVARLNRGLHQMLRIIGNMTDALRYTAATQHEVRNIGNFFDEVFEKAHTLMEHTGIRLTCQGLSEEILCLADGEQLERAFLNMLSNAMKFTPKGGTIHVSLTRNGRMLRLSVLDSGFGIAEHVRSSVFSRYLRQPGIEDGRHGIGLGLVLIRSAAANHGGTVLIDQPQGTGTRITMTIAIRQNAEGLLHSPIQLPDYAGGHDHGLLELSECLPADLYAK